MQSTVTGCWLSLAYPIVLALQNLLLKAYTFDQYLSQPLVITFMLSLRYLLIIPQSNKIKQHLIWFNVMFNRLVPVSINEKTLRFWRMSPYTLAHTHTNTDTHRHRHTQTHTALLFLFCFHLPVWPHWSTMKGAIFLWRLEPWKGQSCKSCSYSLGVTNTLFMQRIIFSVRMEKNKLWREGQPQSKYLTEKIPEINTEWHYRLTVVLDWVCFSWVQTGIWNQELPSWEKFLDEKHSAGTNLTKVRLGIKVRIRG